MQSQEKASAARSSPHCTSPRPNPAPAADPSPPSCPVLSRRRRIGKIARLSHETRELLNTMLRDGAPYASISKKMAELGHTISVDNLSRWHAGGFEDWLQDQARLEEIRLQLDFASNLVHEKNGQLLDAAGLRIAVTRMYTFLLSFDPAKLNNQIVNQPGAYVRILNVLCKLTETSLKCERQRIDAATPSPFAAITKALSHA